MLAVPTGLEPAISAVTGRHPNQLNEGTISSGNIVAFKPNVRNVQNLLLVTLCYV